MKKILLADDHSIVRKGLSVICKSLLANTEIDEAATCSDIMAALKRKQYTHLILDLVMSDGITLEVLPNVRKLYPNLNIMVFSMQRGEIYRRILNNYGISQFVSKSLPEDKTVVLISKFLNNEQPEKSEKFPPPSDTPFSKLAARELEVLYHLLKGSSNGEIANALGLRFSTISTIKNRILEKTGANSLKDLTDLATLYNVT